MTIKRLNATEMEIAGSLTPGLVGTAFHSVVDAFDSESFGMLGFHANSNIFGSSNDPTAPDNGIDFSNVTVEFCPIPEPGTMVLLLGALVALPGLGRRS